MPALIHCRQSSVLNIKNAKDEDAGQYQCYALNVLGQSNLSSCFVNVLSSKTWSSWLYDVVVVNVYIIIIVVVVVIITVISIIIDILLLLLLLLLLIN